MLREPASPAPRHQMPAARRLLWRVLLGFIVFVMLAEAGMRLIGLGHSYESDPNAYLRSSDPDVVFDLKPGYRGFSDGAEVAVSSQGLRDHEVAIPAPPNTSRILVLGDSVTFGLGVHAEETFCERLEAMLSGNTAERRYEVINAGVIGYNTIQERAKLEQVGPRVEPDVVILMFVVNDLLDTFSIFERQYEPTDVLAPVKKWLRRNSRLYRFYQNTTWRIIDSRRTDSEQAEKPRDGRRMVEREAEISRIAELSRHAGAHFLLALYPDNLDNPISPRAPGQAETVRNELRQFAARSGFPVVDLTGALGDVRDPRARAMRLREDPHPSPAGHRAIAEALLERVQADGLLAHATPN
jgi:lysophospholipase L1-like esterase